MKSMTGFGRAFLDAENFDVTVDISSVNRKGLEVGFNAPRDWQPMERQVSASVKEYFTRGKVQVSFKVNFKTCEGVFFLNAPQLREALGIFKKTCEGLGLEYIANSDTLLHINSMLPRENCDHSLADWEPYWAKIRPSFIEALENINTMRATEGQTLVNDFLNRLGNLESLLSDIKNLSADTVENYRAALLQRLRSLGLELDLSDERVLKEIAIFADKADISEETTRLSSHISQFKQAMASDEISGRKMDFLCQEMGREINTIGSKANNLEVSKAVINFKNELERIREQVQNVE